MNTSRLLAGIIWMAASLVMASGPVTISNMMAAAGGIVLVLACTEPKL